MGTEIFVSDKDEEAEWILSDLDVILLWFFLFIQIHF